MIRRPPRSTQSSSSAASDVYKRQVFNAADVEVFNRALDPDLAIPDDLAVIPTPRLGAVSYTHLRAHETVLDLVCRLLLEKKKNSITLQFST